MTHLTRPADDSGTAVEELSGKKAKDEKSPSAEVQRKPEQASLPLSPPDGSDLFAVASRISAEPTVVLGSKVKVQNIADGKNLAFILVVGENAPECGKVCIHTPLGEALLDAQIGDEVEYQVGSHIKEVRVLEIK